MNTQLTITIDFNRSIIADYFPGECCRIVKGNVITINKLSKDLDLSLKFYTILDEIIKLMPMWALISPTDLSILTVLDKEKVEKFLIWLNENDLDISNMLIDYNHS